MGLMASQITSITIFHSTVNIFRHRSKKTSKLRVTGLCEVNSLVTGEFPTQRASNTENVSIWWRHHEYRHRHCHIAVVIAIVMQLSWLWYFHYFFCQYHCSQIWLSETHIIIWRVVLPGLNLGDGTVKSARVCAPWHESQWRALIISVAITLATPKGLQTISKEEAPLALNDLRNGSLTIYAKLRVAHAPGMSGTFSPPPWVRDPDRDHGTCVTHVPSCMPGSLTSGFL